jgi:hypothetical protein
MSINGLDLASNLTQVVAVTTPNRSFTTGILTTALTAPSLTPASTTTTRSSSPTLAGYLNQIDGTLTFNNGSLVSNLSTPIGNLRGTFNLKQLFSDATAYIRRVSGVLNLDRGIAAGTLTIANQSTPTAGSALTNVQSFAGRFNFADFAGNYLSDLVKDIKGPQPFDRGVLKLNVPTQFGAIAGTVDFGTGTLITNLDTPIGKIQTSTKLPDTLKVPFNVSGINGEVNFGRGQIIARVPVIGSQVAIPLSSLSGNFAFDNGQVRINVPTTLGTINTTVDLAKIVDDAVTNALTTAKGTLTIADSKLGIDLTSSLGAVKGTLDVAQLLKTYEPIVTQARGTLTFKGGVLTSTVTTPQGSLAGTVNYGKLLTDGIKIRA